MTAAKTNERPGTKAIARHVRVSAYKAREVLDLIRDLDVRSADEVLQFSERDIATVVRKVLRSAIANAEHNDEQVGDDLYVAACFADEGKTIRRMRPRARGRATRIRKRSCHITIIVARLPEDRLERRRAKEATRPGSRAARRAGQEAAEQRSGRSRSRRRGGGGQAAPDEQGAPSEPGAQAAPTEPTASDVAAAEESEGIVDQQAPAVAAAEEAASSDPTAASATTGETADATADTTTADSPDATGTDTPAGEDAGTTAEASTADSTTATDGASQQDDASQQATSQQDQEKQ